MDVRLERNGFTEKSAERLRRRKKRRRRARFVRLAALTTVFCMALFFVFGSVFLLNYLQGLSARKASSQSIASEGNGTGESAESIKNKEWGAFYAAQMERPPLEVELLTVNNYSRPGEALPEVKNIFIHYTANAGTSAEQNRSYFEWLKDTKERSASAHFVIGYEGEIVQCIPTGEIAYAVMTRNYDSLSIECCFLDPNGKFTQKTYDSLIKMTAWLLHKFELSPEDVLRHYDVGGKNCPKYYVENEAEWNRFISDLRQYMKSIA